MNPQPLGGSDWAHLPLSHSQPSTLNHQPTGAPLNQERRFIPLRLDDAPVKGSLAQFHYINWRPQDRPREHAETLGHGRQWKCTVGSSK